MRGPIRPPATRSDSSSTRRRARPRRPSWTRIGAGASCKKYDLWGYDGRRREWWGLLRLPYGVVARGPTTRRGERPTVRAVRMSQQSAPPARPGWAWSWRQDLSLAVVVGAFEL